jgi:hypothetical protein
MIGKSRADFKNQGGHGMARTSKKRDTRPMNRDPWSVNTWTAMTILRPGRQRPLSG